MEVKIKNRNNEFIEVKNGKHKTLRFLYGTFIGRTMLKALTRPVVSKAAGAVMNSRMSAGFVKGFVQKNGIDLSEYEKSRFKSYNEFFTRKIKSIKRPVDKNNEAFISPCDSKLLVFDINKDSEFCIKESYYSTGDLIGDNEKAKEFNGGKCLIFRLSVDDYHRYCYIDDGTKGKSKFIKGELHTVNPIALKKYNIYKRNCRYCTFLETENFGEVAQIEVGAMMVGRIVNYYGKEKFKRGEEKGYFEFGGSTVVLLVKKGYIYLDDDILKNSLELIETKVKLGERIGGKLQ